MGAVKLRAENAGECLAGGGRWLGGRLWRHLPLVDPIVNPFPAGKRCRCVQLQGQGAQIQPTVCILTRMAVKAVRFQKTRNNR